MACSCVGTEILRKMLEGPFWEGVWLCLDSWDSVRLRTLSTYWNVPQKYGPHGEVNFFLINKEPVVASDDVSSNPLVSAETHKACALIGLHLREAGSSGSQPSWNESALAPSETSFGCEEYEHNNECLATEVIGQDWPSEAVALFHDGWELGLVALSCHMAMDLLCQDACWGSSESLGSPCSL